MQLLFDGTKEMMMFRKLLALFFVGLQLRFALSAPLFFDVDYKEPFDYLKILGFVTKIASQVIRYFA